MAEPLAQLLARHDASCPLEEASTLPAPYYVDPRVVELERRAVFSRNWQVVARATSFYFADVASDGARARNRASIEVAQRIQEEDVAICASVQRGLRSRAYDAGRLSVRREAGEHLFHRLLASEPLDSPSRTRPRLASRLCSTAVLRGARGGTKSQPALRAARGS